ncbi:hypothetical protein PtB15_10B236 [Puccinia triticina]|nr:hypothetical protein PtB15_10B236 [Puccinia triticina]
MDQRWCFPQGPVGSQVIWEALLPLSGRQGLYTVLPSGLIAQTHLGAGRGPPGPHSASEAHFPAASNSNYGAEEDKHATLIPDLELVTPASVSVQNSHTAPPTRAPNTASSDIKFIEVISLPNSGVHQSPGCNIPRSPAADRPTSLPRAPCTRKTPASST